MKVVAFNGNPHKNGNTALAMNAVLRELEKEGMQIMSVLGQNMAWVTKQRNYSPERARHTDQVMETFRMEFS